MTQITDTQWAGAISHLGDLTEAYEELAGLGMATNLYFLNVILDGLNSRINSGERTLELYDEIMAQKL